MASNPDVSILFTNSAQADLAANGREWVLSEGHFTAVARCSHAPLALTELDTRLLPPEFNPGAASIDVTLGGQSQFELRQALSNPDTGGSAFPHPWGATGVMTGLTSFVTQLLARGGLAVVLHRAGGVIKPAAMFLEALEQERHAAWLDVTAAADGRGGVLCRSYGMPHYFGSPNVRAASSTTDFVALECTMAAVRFVCWAIAEQNQNPYACPGVMVPSFRVAGRELPSVEWAATYDDDTLSLILSRR